MSIQKQNHYLTTTSMSNQACSKQACSNYLKPQNNKFKISTYINLHTLKLNNLNLYIFLVSLLFLQHFNPILTCTHTKYVITDHPIPTKKPQTPFIKKKVRFSASHVPVNHTFCYSPTYHHTPIIIISTHSLLKVVVRAPYSDDHSLR